MSTECERCGAPLPEGARFCPSCGSAVVAVPEERKVVTVCFVDLAGSTELSSRLDPERFREILAAFYRLVTEELAAVGGRVENFIGDAVLGVFGLPQSHDDDAVRAIRASLSIIERTDRLGESLGPGVPMRVRVGVNTGPVAIAAASGRDLVLGAEINLAARLQEAAEPGEVLAGETTWRLAALAVEFGPERKVEAKGFEEEVPAWPVIRLAARASRRRIPLVGRSSELDLLAGTFERAVERSRAHLVTLLGEPGIGKSRIAEEFLARLPEGARVLAGRATPFGENATLSPIAELLLHDLGEPHDVPADRLRHRLEELVGSCCHPSQVAPTVARLAPALGLGEEPGTEVGEEDRYRIAEARAGLLTLVTGLSRSGPVVLVLEDLQLAQPQFLELVEQLVREARRLPLMVLCVARWDLLDYRPDWAGGIADAVTLWVERLPADEATRLALEAGVELPQDEAERIAAHAGGNPFFIVETAAMLAREGRAMAAGGPRGLLLPPTVQAVIAARLDHLSPGARDVVRKASVFSRPTFELEELALIVRPSEEALDELENEEILVGDEDGEGVWRFRHDLLRDVAYESLTKRERRELHLRIAEHLEGPERRGRYPRAIAYHLEQAARASLDLNPRDRALADRAVDALGRAGDLARRGIESQAAADLYERALGLAGPEHAWGAREAWILSAMGEARYWRGEFDVAAAALSRALEAGGGDTRIVAHASRFLADIHLTIRGDGTRAEELFHMSLEASRELGDPVVLARTLLMAAWVPYWAQDLGRAREMFAEALEIARSKERRDAWAEARALTGLAAVTSPVGDEMEALALAQQALAIGEESRDRFTTAVAREHVANSLRRMLELDEALEHSSASIKTFRELDARWELASALGDRGAIRGLAQRFDEAERDLREAFRLCRDLKERSLVTWTAAELARLLVQAGQVAEARHVLEEPHARLAASEPGSLASLLFAEATVAIAEGDPEGARAKAVEALEAERAQGWRNQLASAVWWTGRVFGPDLVGGEEELSRARATLESAHWLQALRDPERVRG